MLQESFNLNRMKEKKDSGRFNYKIIFYGMFQVHLGNDKNPVLDYASGRIRRNFFYTYTLE